MISRVHGARNGLGVPDGQGLDVNGAVLAGVQIRSRPALPEFDVRLETNNAVKRGWAEIGRRTVRLFVLLTTDSVAAGLAILISATIAGVSLVPFASATSGDLTAAALLLFLQPLAISVSDGYGMGAKRMEFGRIVQGVVLTAVLAWGFTLLPARPSIHLYRGFLVTYAGVGAALVVAGRLALDRLISLAYGLGVGQRRVLVVGSSTESAMVERLLGAQRGCDVRVIGRLSPKDSGDDGAVGTVAELESVLHSTGARGIILASNLSFEAFETVVRRCFEAGAVVSVVPRSLHHYGTRLEVRRAPASALLELYPQGLRFPQFAIKRLMDVMISMAALALLSPAMVLIAVAIKLDSHGPVLFRQRRAGLGGRPFSMYKFRTMVSGADQLKAKLLHLNESGDPRLFKIRRDPRVTRIGRWLRRTSLDELPQLFNVLHGEMSLVGPRPFFPEDIQEYEDHHFERLSVLPGITGLWQVSGRSDIVDFEEVVRMDTAYIRRWSIGMDIGILCKTIPAAFGRGGAY